MSRDSLSTMEIVNLYLARDLGVDDKCGLIYHDNLQGGNYSLAFLICPPAYPVAITSNFVKTTKDIDYVIQASFWWFEIKDLNLYITRTEFISRYKITDILYLNEG